MGDGSTVAYMELIPTALILVEKTPHKTPVTKQKTLNFENVNVAYNIAFYNSSLLPLP